MSLSPGNASDIRSESPMDTSFDYSSQGANSSHSLSPPTNQSAPSLFRYQASTPIDLEDEQFVLEEVPDDSVILTPSVEDRSSSQLSNLSNQSRLTPSNIFCASPPLLMDNQLPSMLKPTLPLEEELYSPCDLFDTTPDHVTGNLSRKIEHNSNESFINHLLNDENLSQLRFDNSNFN